MSQTQPGPNDTPGLAKLLVAEFERAMPKTIVYMVSRLQSSCLAGPSGRTLRQSNHWPPGLLATLAPSRTNTHASSWHNSLCSCIKSPRKQSDAMPHKLQIHDKANTHVCILICIRVHPTPLAIASVADCRAPARLEVVGGTSIAQKI